MENNRSLYWNTAMKWGLFIALALVVESLAFYFAGKTGNPAEGWLQYPIVIGGLVWASLSYRKQLPEKAPFSYGNSLGFGVVTMMFTSIVMAVYAFLMYGFIDPELLDKMILTAEERLLESGLSESLVEQQISITKTFMTPGFMAFSQIFSWIFTGFLISLITSIFLRKKEEQGFSAAMREIDEEE
jgi:hypothetical protein